MTAELAPAADAPKEDAVVGQNLEQVNVDDVMVEVKSLPVQESSFPLRERTASTLGYWIVIGFVGISGLFVLKTMTIATTIDDLLQILKEIGGLYIGLLGFVLGYYFSADKAKNS